MPKTLTKNAKAGDAAIAAKETGGQPVGGAAPLPDPPAVDTTDMSRKEKAAVKAAVSDATPAMYTVTITAQVKPARQDELTLRGPDGEVYLFRRGALRDGMTAEQKDAAKKRRLLTQQVRMTPPTARDLTRRGWMVAPAAEAKE
jgi:hypothetical protein